MSCCPGSAQITLFTRKSLSRCHVPPTLSQECKDIPLCIECIDTRKSASECQSLFRCPRRVQTAFAHQEPEDYKTSPAVPGVLLLEISCFQQIHQWVSESLPCAPGDANNPLLLGNSPLGVWTWPLSWDGIDGYPHTKFAQRRSLKPHLRPKYVTNEEKS